MNSRDDILASIRSNLPRLDRPLPHVPAFDNEPPISLLEAFKTNLHRMGGMYLSADHRGRPGAGSGEDRGRQSRVLGGSGNCGQSRYRRNWHVVASRGCGLRHRPRLLCRCRDWLRPVERRRPPVNAVGYLAQHLIVLLDPANIVINLHHAYRRPEFRNGHYACFHTGPSATADIEGVLIHGAQGVRSLSVLPAAHAADH